MEELYLRIKLEDEFLIERLGLDLDFLQRTFVFSTKLFHHFT